MHIQNGTPQTAHHRTTQAPNGTCKNRHKITQAQNSTSIKRHTAQNGTLHMIFISTYSGKATLSIIAKYTGISRGRSKKPAKILVHSDLVF
jgi:hypothetical protein